MTVEDGQRGEKVIASRIGPSFADQTEGFKRSVVVPNIIDDGNNQFLRDIFAGRHGMENHKSKYCKIL
jgi:hypothetical protein